MSMKAVANVRKRDEPWALTCGAIRVSKVISIGVPRGTRCFLGLRRGRLKKPAVRVGQPHRTILKLIAKKKQKKDGDSFCM